MSKKYFEGLTKNTFLLTLTSLFGDISTEMLYPVLPIFLTQILGAGGAIVGIVEGVAVAMQYIVQGLSGALSDKLKKRKPIAVVGYTLAALSKPFIGLAGNWWGVFAARSMDRLGSGTRSAPRDALIAASADEKHRGKAFGFEGIGDNLGAFLGPLLAVALLFYFKLPIRNIFFLSIIPGAISVFMILLVKEEGPKVMVKSKLTFEKFKFPKGYWTYLGATFIFGIGNLSPSFLILQTKNIGVPLVQTILIYAFFNLIAALASYPSGFLSDKMGRKNVLFTAFMFLLFSLVGFSGTKSIPAVIILFGMFGVYQGIFRAVGKAYATDFVTQEHRASAIGWYNTVVGLSGLVASVMAGQIYDKIGHATVFATAAIFVAIGSVLLLVLKSEGEKRKD